MTEVFGNLSVTAIAGLALAALIMSLGSIVLCLHSALTVRKSLQFLEKRITSTAEADRKLRELDSKLQIFDGRLRDADWKARNATQRVVGSTMPQVTESLNTAPNDAEKRRGLGSVDLDLPLRETRANRGEPEKLRTLDHDSRDDAGERGEVEPSTGHGAEDGKEVAEPDVYSLNLVRQLFGAWTKTDVRPRSSRTLEVAMAEYLSSESAAGVGAAAVHVIRDTSSVAEFVRFSAVGAAVGVVLPNPDATFTPAVAHLFPGLTRELHADPAALMAVQPVAVRQRRGPVWEVV